MEDLTKSEGSLIGKLENPSDNVGQKGNEGGGQKSAEDIAKEQLELEAKQKEEQAKQGQQGQEQNQEVKSVDNVFEAENGDLVDKDGKVLIEAKDVKKDKEGNIELPEDFFETPNSEGFDFVKETFINDYGVEFKDKDGKELSFDVTTPEGKKAMLNHVVTEAGYLIHESMQKALFSKYPDVAQYIQLREQGFSPEEAKGKEIVDWDKVKITKDTVEEAKKAIKTLYVKRGFSETKADSIIKAYELDNTLESEGKDAVKELKALQEKEITDRNNQKIYQEQQEKLIAEKEYNTVTQVISNKQFGGIKIADTEVKPFIDYLYKPLDINGNTQAMIDAEQAELDTRLAIEYIRFKKMNLSDIVAMEKNKETVKTIKAKIARHNTSSGSSSSDISKKGNLSTLSFSKIIKGATPMT